ncbi:hypothetical protein I2800192A2_19080 [Anaerostipes hadrus]|uniref:hypothetical protein n=1 Tax=Anaerostipes hadrus TaxID=649756 RepID=UPI0034A7E9E4
MVIIEMAMIGWGIRHNKDGYDKNGYNKEEYNKDGYDFDFAQASITSRFYDKDGTMLENKNFDFENLKAYQSMPSEDTMSPEDCGNSFIDKTGPYQYNCYESETPFTNPVTKEF